ncbi:MAG: DUF1566 domain-containing protein [Spirochaetia bacterium]|nr:DUF1566 domain-containing protein [Spirochaetia bacterium]
MNDSAVPVVCTLDKLPDLGKKLERAGQSAVLHSEDSLGIAGSRGAGFVGMKRHLNIVLLAVLAAIAVSSCKKEDNTDVWTTALLGGGAFTDQNNGTVKDSTGLTWAKCSVGQVWSATLNNCTGTGASTTYGAKSYSYCPKELEGVATCTGTSLEAIDPSEVFKACNTLSLAGTGWRVPTIYELGAYAALMKRDSFIKVFPQTPDDKPFWSGTQNSAESTGKEAKVVYFADSTFGTLDVFNKYNGIGYVRCVR